MSTNTTSQAIMVSWEWAKRLKVAGWPQEGGLFWYEYIEDDPEYWSCCDGHDCSGEPSETIICAPTSEEILRRLPCTIRPDEESTFYLAITSNEDVWCVSYEKASGISKNIFKTDASLANAAAAMYCYLAENKLL